MRHSQKEGKVVLPKMKTVTIISINILQTILLPLALLFSHLSIPFS